MLELALTTVNPASANVARPVNLTFGQGLRFTMALPWQGAQPALIYVKITDRDPDHTKNVPDHDQEMVGAVPETIDVSTRTKQTALLNKCRCLAEDMIGPSKENAVRILKIAFYPMIDGKGMASAADCIGIVQSTVMPHHKRLRDIPGFLRPNNVGNLAMSNK